MSEWISIKDRLPDKADYYLVSWIYDHDAVSGEAWFTNSEWIHPHYGGDEKENPPEPPEITHWMPIPFPPTELVT